MSAAAKKSPKRRIRLSREDVIFNIVSYFIITVLMLLCLYPMWFVACASISDPVRASQAHGIILWPQGLLQYIYG